MKAFTYSPEVVGLAEWPPGTLRLAGTEAVTDPREADIFICPGNLSLFQVNGEIQKDMLHRLTYFAGNESRHVFFDCSENFRKAIGLPCIFIKCDAGQWMLQDDPNTIQMAWPVEDYAECVDIPEGGFKYDVSFQGWLSTDTRTISSQACLDHPGLNCDMSRYSDFTGYIYDQPEGIRRRAEFRRSMKESRIALCPESIPGVLPYRFFEAMSAGRVPLLVSSDYVLPFDRDIPYDDFIIRCEREYARDAGTMAQEFVSAYSDSEIQEMGRQARAHWTLRLNRDDWPVTMTMAVEAQLQKMGIPCG